MHRRVALASRDLPGIDHSQCSHARASTEATTVSRRQARFRQFVDTRREYVMHDNNAPNTFTVAPRTQAVAWAAGIAGVLAVATLFASSSSARAVAAQGKKSPAKPTIVLVHGAWADGSSWNGVTARLQADGYTVDVPPNPLRSLSSDSTYLASFLSTISGPIVLAGHSYGGAVITNAATGNANVKALVYVDAYIPDQDQSLVDLTGAGSCFAVQDLRTVFNFVPIPGAPSDDLDTYVLPGVFPGCFANGLPAQEGAVLAATQRPLTTAALFEKSGVPAWKTIPSWALVGLDDHVIPPTGQLTMAHDAGAKITEIHAPHLSMLSDPAAVTKVIEHAARATS
jgi:pimeloyl-ACP methyl ester carboxylesterase